MSKPDSTILKYQKLYTSVEYQKYFIQKQEIQSRYPPHIICDCDKYQKNSEPNLTTEEWGLWKQYLKEVMDLIHEPDGTFQDVLRSMETQRDEEIAERIVRGRRQPKIEY